MLPLFQDNFILVEATSSHFFRVTTSTQQLLFRDSYFFRTAAFFSFFRTVTFSQESFFQNSFFFGAKFLPSYNTILRIIVPCHNSCKKNKQSTKQSFRICLPVIICLSWWKNISKKEEISSYLIYNIVSLARWLEKHNRFHEDKL